MLICLTAVYDLFRKCWFVSLLLITHFVSVDIWCVTDFVIIDFSMLPVIVSNLTLIYLSVSLVLDCLYITCCMSTDLSVCNFLCEFQFFWCNLLYECWVLCVTYLGAPLNLSPLAAAGTKIPETSPVLRTPRQGKLRHDESCLKRERKSMAYSSLGTRRLDMWVIELSDLTYKVKCLSSTEMRSSRRLSTKSLLARFFCCRVNEERCK